VPFLICDTPHINFADNQPAYGSAMVLVLSFAATGTVAAAPTRRRAAGLRLGRLRVLVNLEALACHPITFSTAELAGAVRRCVA